MYSVNLDFDLALLSLEISCRATCGLGFVQTDCTGEGPESINSMKNEQGQSRQFNTEKHVQLHFRRPHAQVLLVTSKALSSSNEWGHCSTRT